MREALTNVEEQAGQKQVDVVFQPLGAFNILLVSPQIIDLLTQFW